VVEYAATLSNVAYAEENLFSCSADMGRHITETIREKELNRVVVAACTPRTHEALFQDTLQEAGINKYLFELANIREHCSWVHSLEKLEATAKAKDIVRMAVERVKRLFPLEEIEVPVIPRGLVLGGGLAGMSASLGLARQGFEVYLVEKGTELGGNLRKVYHTIEGMSVKPFLERLCDEVEKQEKITVLKGYALGAFSGAVGNFTSTLVSCQEDSEGNKRIEVQHGAIIVATGATELKPAEYHYGESDRVLTQQELEAVIAEQALPKDVRSVVMIQCVGARNEERGYCGRICCAGAIKNALTLKELNDQIEVTVFYRDIRTYGATEEYYDQARERGVLFMRYSPERKPELRLKEGKTILRYYDPVLHMEDELQPDLVVLSTPAVPEGTRALSQLLHVPVTDDGFFLEAHMKLRPLDFATEGIFVCGIAHYPKGIGETISQADGAAVRAATILCQKSITTSGAAAVLDDTKCIGCGMCEAVCPYSAFAIQEELPDAKAKLFPELCRGCGTCVARCPREALSLNHFTDEQILAQIAAVA
jgi:heterodisulfide reductase subunit A